MDQIEDTAPVARKGFMGRLRAALAFRKDRGPKEAAVLPEMLIDEASASADADLERAFDDLSAELMAEPSVHDDTPVGETGPGAVPSVDAEAEREALDVRAAEQTAPDPERAPPYISSISSARSRLVGFISARSLAAAEDSIELPHSGDVFESFEDRTDEGMAEVIIEAEDAVVVGDPADDPESIPVTDAPASTSAIVALFDKAADGRDMQAEAPATAERADVQGPAEAALPVPHEEVLRPDGTPLPRHRLGEFVLRKGLITAAQLDAASREQAVTGDRIGQILVSNGFLTDKERVSAILATSSERIAQENVARSRIPPDILDEFNIMISAETEDTVYVSTMSDEETVERIVAEYYPSKHIRFVSFLPTTMNSFIASMKKTSSIDDASQTKETMLDRTLYWALNEGASDIHVVPRRKSYTTMFRMLGVRNIVHEGGLDEYKTMIAQIKDKARMDLAERRKPQDGGFQIEYNGKMIDLRVATLPAAEGEICIMRVLDPDRVQPSLGQLGITDVEKWRKGFSQQHGLCLICGPTGSGKTTTLNSSIKEMDRFGKAIYSVEDPVEYRIPYVGQISTNASVGLDFATAVRAFMRADPDVIVLGEVRDEDTARNAIKAADTGHLVLATLHTGSIQGTVSRLKDLGVAPRELRYLLRSVLVQTLVRTTCRHCNGSGCDKCKGGYSGRTVVSECEYFEDYDAVDNVLNSIDEDVVRTWPTMLEDAVGKYRQGLTDLPELYRVFGAAVDPHLRGK